MCAERGRRFRGFRCGGMHHLAKPNLRGPQMDSLPDPLLELVFLHAAGPPK